MAKAFPRNVFAPNLGVSIGGSLDFFCSRSANYSHLFRIKCQICRMYASVFGHVKVTFEFGAAYCVKSKISHKCKM
jgi:hypothetical protein